MKFELWLVESYTCTTFESVKILDLIYYLLCKCRHIQFTEFVRISHFHKLFSFICSLYALRIPYLIEFPLLSRADKSKTAIKQTQLCEISTFKILGTYANSLIVYLLTIFVLWYIQSFYNPEEYVFIWSIILYSFCDQRIELFFLYECR